MNFNEIVKYYEELPFKIKNNPYFQAIEHIVNEDMKELLLEKIINDFNNKYAAGP